MILFLDWVKVLKSVVEVILNDVVLGICVGVLRRYLKEKDKLLIKFLVVMVLIFIRIKIEDYDVRN